MITLLKSALAGLVLAVCLFAPVHAQTPPPAVVETTGVSVAEARAWLTGLGGSVGEPVLREGATTLHIADQPLPWNLTFYGCGPTLCDDIQYSAVFTGQITFDQINGWNRDNRFLKAFFDPATPGSEARAVIQFDAVLSEVGADQLRERTVIWLQQQRAFAQVLAGQVPTRQTAVLPDAVRPVATPPAAARSAQYVEADTQTCERYGYSRGGVGFADCMMQIDMARRAQARADAEYNQRLAAYQQQVAQRERELRDQRSLSMLEMGLRLMAGGSASGGSSGSAAPLPPPPQSTAPQTIRLPNGSQIYCQTIGNYTTCN